MSYTAPKLYYPQYDGTNHPRSRMSIKAYESGSFPFINNTFKVMFISKHQHIGIIVKITALVDFFLEENEERERTEDD